MDEHVWWHRWFEWWPRKKRGDVHTGIFMVRGASYYECRFCGTFFRYDTEDPHTFKELMEAIENA